MANAFLTLRTQKSNLPQMVYLGYVFGKSQILYPTGIKITPKQWDNTKKMPKNVSFLHGETIKENLPFKKADFKFNYEHITSILSNLKIEVNIYANENKENLTKESLKIFLDSLYLPKNKELNHFVNELSSHLKEILIEKAGKNKEISKSDLIEIAIKYLESERPTNDFFEYLNSFIKGTEDGTRLINGVQYGYRTIQKFKSTESILKEFELWNKKKITFESIDKIFETQLLKFMAEVKNYQPNTMGKFISILKNILKQALLDEKHNNIKFQNFKVFTEESDNIALTETEIEALFKLDLKHNARLDAVRDMFVLGCHSGLRWSDFTDIKPDNIKQNKQGQIIDIIQTKTKNQVVIPVNGTIEEILKKYNNKLPEPITNQKFNEYIKEIARMIPELNVKETLAITRGGKTTEETLSRWELISSHTARRSFATNAFEKGIEVKLIRAITGHKSDKSFYAYIKTSLTKQAEMFREKNK